MQLSREDLDEFKQIMKEDYGVELDDKETHRLATKVINLFKIIYRPLPEGKKNE